jgi:hypothetical protein
MGSAVDSGAAHRRAWWTRRAAALRRQWGICWHSAAFSWAAATLVIAGYTAVVRRT